MAATATTATGAGQGAHLPRPGRVCLCPSGVLSQPGVWLGLPVPGSGPLVASQGLGAGVEGPPRVAPVQLRDLPVAEMAAPCMGAVTPVRAELPGPRSWAVFRRSLGPTGEVKFYLSNAPANCHGQELVRVSGMRWPVETAIEEGRGEAGMDHYETRTWQGWHRHMAHTFLAHLFLIRLRWLWQKKPCLNHGASSPTYRAGYRRRSVSVTQRVGHPALSAMPQPCRLLFSSQANLETAESTFQFQKTQNVVVI